MLSIRRLVFSFKSVAMWPELDRRSCPAAESLIIISRVEVYNEFFPCISFCVYNYFPFQTPEKGSDVQSASARRVSLTWVVQSLVHHGLDLSVRGRWVGLVILKKLWLR